MTDLNRNVSYRDRFVGLDLMVPLYNGNQGLYINFDNAASTPPLKSVQKAINDFMPYYSSVHRGTGYKSQLSTHAYEMSRLRIMDFVDANPDEYVCIFGKNTTEAINKLSRRFPFTLQRDIVLTSGMEHHSNDLPWRAVAETIHVNLLPDGRLDESDFDRKLDYYNGRIALVAITGASNVTGYLNPIHRLARKAHSIGAHILVDAAQLSPHRRVKMLRLDDPEHIDYLTISAHKMYAPFGTGALIGRRDTFERGDPDQVGGGTVEIVTLNDVVWANPPDRDEAGSPNTVGAVGLAAAMRELNQVGMDAVAEHEAELTSYALTGLRKVPGIKIFGDRDINGTKDRLGVIPFLLESHNHFLVAAVLGHEFGIGVRSGCFCAHPYILSLLGLNDEEAREVRDQMLNGDKSKMPGLIRASFGLYNDYEEIDHFVDALTKIANNEFTGNYVQDRSSGEYHLLNWKPGFEHYFSI